MIDGYSSRVETAWTAARRAIAETGLAVKALLVVDVRTGATYLREDATPHPIPPPRKVEFNADICEAAMQGDPSRRWYVPELAVLTGARRPAVRQALRALVDAGRVHAEGNTRARWYQLTRYQGGLR